jgi:peptidoglycan/xylan/chitin deacetylase (PgdA/CDA1 family)
MPERPRSEIVSGVEVPVLMYHEVSPSPHPAFRRYTVTVRDFTRQMRWLAAFGYQPIDMDTLVRARQGHASLPKRPVVITFDDGFQGCADYAVPALRIHGFTAVFYLVAGLMGATSRWLRPELGMELGLMSWDTARSLAAEGFRCGAHTLTHPRLSGLDPARRRAELVDARRRMEDELGQPVVHLAYPYGAFDQAVQAAAAEAGYVTACSTRPGRSGAGDDLMALHRVTVYGHDSLLDFACRLRTGAAVRERLGQAFGGVARRLTSPRGTGS